MWAATGCCTRPTAATSSAWPRSTRCPSSDTADQADGAFSSSGAASAFVAGAALGFGSAILAAICGHSHRLPPRSRSVNRSAEDAAPAGLQHPADLPQRLDRLVEVVEHP